MLVKRILREFISPYYKTVLLSIFFMIIIAMLTAVNAYIMKPILDDIFTDHNLQMLKILPIFIIVIALIKGFSTYMADTLKRIVEVSILIDVQKRMFKKVLFSDLSALKSVSTGSIISHFINDINILKNSISGVLTNLVKESLTLIFLLALIFYYIPKLAIITFFVFPLAIYPVYILGRKMRKISTNTQMELGQFTKQLDETFQGINVVKAYNAEATEMGHINKLMPRLFRLYKKEIRTDSLSSPITELIGGIALALVITFGGIEVINGNISEGTFMLFIASVISAYKPLKSLTKFNNMLQMGLAAAERIFNTLDQKSNIIEKPDSKLLINRGDIKFNNISFSYKESEKAVKNFSINIPEGQTIALVGPSGSGKSTIMNLLLRFYDVDSGSIMIDDQNITEYSFKNLRSKIAYVSQDVFLFDDTIKSNIAYGSDGNVSDEQIIAAAKYAEADEFIVKLEDGYDSYIGQGGSRLSGGQKQRIVIARALLKDAKIILLDEATSALDPVSESKIKNAMNELLKNKTSIIIAHRLDTIKNADLIYMISNGSIIASGTHEKLLNDSAEYCKFYYGNIAE
ncbi:MAG: ATP-binding cassette domain-containing protein [Rickettsiales bacterium]|jgi:ATP-binding cassette, subfamily B, bacterial MsbA|nr:ATP-binding cassette domain-containing protein [Rickettsiales bacterium]